MIVDDSSHGGRQGSLHAIALASGVLSILVISLVNVVYYFVRDCGKSSSCFWMGRAANQAVFSQLSYSTWKRLHIITQLTFWWSTVLLSIVETLFFLAGRHEKYFPIVPLLDHFVALPLLAATCLTGLALTYKRYFQLGKVPHPIVERVMTALNLFGLFWAAVEKTLQVIYSDSTPPFWSRLVSILGSILFSIYIRKTMMQMACLEKSS